MDTPGQTAGHLKETPSGYGQFLKPFLQARYIYVQMASPLAPFFNVPGLPVHEDKIFTGFSAWAYAS
jgi:hypothetical protein